MPDESCDLTSALARVKSVPLKKFGGVSQGTLIPIMVSELLRWYTTVGHTTFTGSSALNEVVDLSKQNHRTTSGLTSAA